ncbi:hypothetical protein [Rufibacter psychrotolerans]|uniref:hypothetical protein n=1 Tax=Rufibacter psychrotolerans TaxID=2812556 RepID=UPI001968243F|nr:hypothetical protein [Rufibacter sp. SYSU D00308]
MLLYVQLLLILAFSGTEPEFEQLAADHFFKNIFSEKYPDLKAAELDTKTDSTLHFGIVMNCQQWDEETRKKVYSGGYGKQQELALPNSDIKIKKHRKYTNRLKIAVSPRRKVGDNFYVEVIAYKKLNFVDYFIFRFERDGRLVSICNKSEII